MAQRVSFDPAIKPLMAALKRLSIGRFLHTKVWDHIALENGWDETWMACEKAVAQTRAVFIVGHHNSEDDEDALGLFLSEEYGFNASEFEDLLFVSLHGFLDWTQAEVDMLGVIGQLKELDLPKDRIKRLAEATRAANARVRAQTQAKPTELAPKAGMKTTAIGSKVFIVHGHDEKARASLEVLLRDELGLEPIVVQDQPSDTIESVLQKIERLAGVCHAAIVLMTPDDETSLGKRPRQNVVLELGYFLGRWQGMEQRRIIVLKHGAMEIPSDISGVIYLNYHTSPKEVYLALRDQFKHWGFKTK